MSQVTIYYDGWVTRSDGVNIQQRGSVRIHVEADTVEFDSVDAKLSPYESKVLGEALVAWANRKLNKRHEDLVSRIETLAHKVT